MQRNKLNQLHKINFQSNLRFIPVTNKEEAKIVAKIIGDYKQEHITDFPFLYKLIKPLDIKADTFFLSESIRRGLPHHITIVKKDDSILGAYSVEYDSCDENKAASVDFIYEASDIKHTKAAKRFFANVAENIYKTLSKYNIKNINYELNRPELAALFKSSSNKQIHTLDIDELKNNIDKYRYTEGLL